MFFVAPWCLYRIRTIAKKLDPKGRFTLNYKLLVIYLILYTVRYLTHWPADILEIKYENTLDDINDGTDVYTLGFCRMRLCLQASWATNNVLILANLMIAFPMVLRFSTSSDNCDQKFKLIFRDTDMDTVLENYEKDQQH